jgi:uncharacterized protein HemX
MFGLNKLTLYLLIGLFSVGAAATTYYVWKRNIQNQARLEFNQKQLEQTAKEQAEFIRKQQEIADQQAAATRALTQQNEELNRRMSGIDRFLNSSQSQDRPSSEILKRTIEMLRTGTTQ